tara:strand:- start:19988 stop:20452 length:465 start_codon:yes stop_codon:yes gene_type:complete
MKKIMKVDAETKKEIKIATAAYAVSLIVIIIIGITIKITGKDIMHKTVFESKWLGKLCGENGMYCSWPISHFILYLFLGIACPRIWPFLFALGIVWEIIEWIIGSFELESKGKVSKIAGEEQYSNGWMTGKWSDLIFNGAGLALGLGIRKVYDS